MSPKKTPAAKKVAAQTTKSEPVVVSEKPVKTYKGLCIFLTAFLYVELIAMILICHTFDIDISMKRPHHGYTIQYQNLPAYQKLKKAHHGKRHHVRKANADKARKLAEQKQLVKDRAKQAKAAKPAVKCPDPVARKSKYIESQYAPYAVAGNAKIQGKACFTLNDGTEKCFPGLPVYINPVTDYSDEWYERGWVGTEYLEEADKRVLPFNKSVKADKDGSYTFDGLAPGSYYVVTQFCQPTGKESRVCEYRRYGTKVTMKNLVRPTLKQLFPKKK